MDSSFVVINDSNPGLGHFGLRHHSMEDAVGEHGPRQMHGQASERAGQTNRSCSTKNRLAYILHRNHEMRKKRESIEWATGKFIPR